MPIKRQGLLAAMVALVTMAHVGLLAMGFGTGMGQGLTWQPDARRSVASPMWQVRSVRPSLPATSPTEPATQASPAAPSPAPAAPAAPAAAAEASPPKATGGFNDYLPRHLLTVGPRPETPVIIDYPAHWNLPGRRSGRLAIYIDEHGTVRRVEALDNDLVPAMVEAARSAFLSARFLPGERSGQAVRTRMEVEVDFDAGP